MANSRYALALIILALLFSLNCKKKQEDYFADLDKDEFHWVVYTNPSRDCIDCIRTALTIVDEGTDKSLPITFLLVKSEDAHHFKVYIQDTFKKRRFKFIEKNTKLNYPHPSILLIRDKGIYMYFFIYNDPFLFSEYFSKCRELFLNSNYQVSNQP